MNSRPGDDSRDLTSYGSFRSFQLSSNDESDKEKELPIKKIREASSSVTPIHDMMGQTFGQHSFLPLMQLLVRMKTVQRRHTGNTQNAIFICVSIRINMSSSYLRCVSSFSF
ncbi:unnamed protein product [Adineta steineri]|uniref:Uncharacterized protein n=1 Tax=Adineta steineri TaxID=433720 RepID=A0A814I0Z4_9BILA|nr:unnamed protein product [Adineta steineri]CAF1424265.1 unnamed protein product [Adineta steineri]CAF1458187.1 unnamed protein product [Adineta steineri]